MKYPFNRGDTYYGISVTRIDEPLTGDITDFGEVMEMRWNSISEIVYDTIHKYTFESRYGALLEIEKRKKLWLNSCKTVYKTSTDIRILNLEETITETYFTEPKCLIDWEELDRRMEI